MPDTSRPQSDPIATALARVRVDGGVVLVRAPADGAATDWLRAAKTDVYHAAQPGGFGPAWAPWGGAVATLVRTRAPIGWLDDDLVLRPLSALGPRTAAALRRPELPEDAVTPTEVAAAIVALLELAPASIALDRLERAPAIALEVLKIVCVELPPGASLLLGCADGPVADRLEPAIRAAGGSVLYAFDDDVGESLRAVERRIAALDLAPAIALATWALDRIAEAGDRRAEAIACARIASALRDAGAAPETWEAIVRRGLRLTPEVRDERVVLRLALLVSSYERIPGPIPASIRAAPDPHLQAAIARLGDRSLALAALDTFAYRSRDEALAMAAEVASFDNPADRYRLLDIAGRCLLYLHGDHRAAEPLFVAAEAEGERVGLHWARASGIFQQATCRLARGEIDDAIAMVDVATETIVRLGLGHRLRAASSVGFRGSVAILRGGPWPALREAAASAIAAPGSERTALGVMAAAYDAVFAREAGALGEARARVRGVIVVANASGPRGYIIPGVTQLAGLAAVGLGDRPLAEYVDAVLDGQQAIHGPPYLVMTIPFIRGRIAVLADPGAGAEALEAAALDAESHGMRAVAALARTSAALAYASVGDGRAAPLAELVAPDLAELTMTPSLLALRDLLGGRRFETSMLPGGLTARESEVLALLAGGATTAEIASMLTLSPHTVNRHVANVYAKIGAHNRADATAFAIRSGIAEGALR